MHFIALPKKKIHCYKVSFINLRWMVHFASDHFLIHNELKILNSLKCNMISYRSSPQHHRPTAKHYSQSTSPSLRPCPPVEKKQEECTRFGNTTDCRNIQTPCRYKFTTLRLNSTSSPS